MSYPSIPVIFNDVLSGDTPCVLLGPYLMLADSLGTAIQALQRLAASNPMLYKALLHMTKDSHGCISAATLMQVSCSAVYKFFGILRWNTSLHKCQVNAVLAANLHALNQ